MFCVWLGYVDEFASNLAILYLDPSPFELTLHCHTPLNTCTNSCKIRVIFDVSL